MKNFKKFIATILVTTLTMSCVGCLHTSGSASCKPLEETSSLLKPNLDSFFSSDSADVCFYINLLSNFDNPNTLDGTKRNKLLELLKDLNSNIFSMLLLMDTESQKICLLETFMDYNCEKYTQKTNDFFLANFLHLKK